MKVVEKDIKKIPSIGFSADPDVKLIYQIVIS